MAKTPLSTGELEAHLTEQLQLLELSAANFDRGVCAEFKRLAVAVRVLVHETAKSHSLLGQLGRLNIDFADTSLPPDPLIAYPYQGLTTMIMGGPNDGYAAPLDDGLVAVRHAPFQQWWTGEVLRDLQGRSITRRDLVLIAANQDGGAHVDPQIDEVYADISRKNSLGALRQTVEGFAPILGVERATIRQIAHEVFLTLVPGYSKQPDHSGAGMVMRGFTLIEASPEEVTIAKAHGDAKEVRSRQQGRNELCACGSARKYKHCHGVL